MGRLERDPAGQGPAIRTRQALDRKDFLCLQVSARYPGRINSNKQCFHHHFMYTCLLRATQLTDERKTHTRLWPATADAHSSQSHDLDPRGKDK